jgi:hypothetical protein
MTNRRFTLLTFAAVALATFLAPSAASAQSIWDRIRDRAEQERNRDDRNRDDRNNPDYGRDRRGDDRYGRRGGRISDSERRRLNDLARRINDRNKDLQRDIDHLLDNSRINGSRREDNVNQEAHDLRDAAQRFKDVAGDSNDLNRSRAEASNLLDRASRINRVLNRVRVDSRTSSDWNQLRNDLRSVADIYGLRFNDNGGNYGGNDDWRRNPRY